VGRDVSGRLGDPNQQKRLVRDHANGRIEHADDLEFRTRWDQIGWRKQRILSSAKARKCHGLSCVERGTIPVAPSIDQGFFPGRDPSAQPLYLPLPVQIRDHS
jgi:hypothetical protein